MLAAALAVQSTATSAREASFVKREANGEVYASRSLPFNTQALAPAAQFERRPFGTLQLRHDFSLCLIGFGLTGAAFACGHPQTGAYLGVLTAVLGGLMLPEQERKNRLELADILPAGFIENPLKSLQRFLEQREPDSRALIAMLHVVYGFVYSNPGWFRDEEILAVRAAIERPAAELGARQFAYLTLHALACRGQPLALQVVQALEHHPACTWARAALLQIGKPEEFLPGHFPPLTHSLFINDIETAQKPLADSLNAFVREESIRRSGQVSIPRLGAVFTQRTVLDPVAHDPFHVVLMGGKLGFCVWSQINCLMKQVARRPEGSETLVTVPLGAVLMHEEQILDVTKQGFASAMAILSDHCLVSGCGMFDGNYSYLWALPWRIEPAVKLVVAENGRILRVLNPGGTREMVLNFVSDEALLWKMLGRDVADVSLTEVADPTGMSERRVTMSGRIELKRGPDTRGSLDFTYDSLGQIRELKIAWRGDAESIHEAISLSEGRTLHIDCDPDQAPVIRLESPGDIPWIFSGYDIVETFPDKQPERSYVTVSHFTSPDGRVIPALESFDHDEMVPFVEMLSLPAEDTSVVSFDEHPDDSAHPFHRVEYDETSWLAFLKNKFISWRVWVKSSGSTRKNQWGNVIDQELDGPHELQFHYPRNIVTYDADYFSFECRDEPEARNPAHVIRGLGTDIAAVLKREGVEHISAVNLTRSAFGREDYSPREQSTFIANTLVSEHAALFGEVALRKIPGIRLEPEPYRRRQEMFGINEPWWPQPGAGTAGAGIGSPETPIFTLLPTEKLVSVGGVVQIVYRVRDRLNRTFIVKEHKNDPIKTGGRSLWKTQNNPVREMAGFYLARALKANVCDVLVPSEAERRCLARLIGAETDDVYLVRSCRDYKAGDPAVCQKTFGLALTRALGVSLFLRRFDFHRGNHGWIEDSSTVMHFDFEQGFHPDRADMETFTRSFIANYFGWDVNSLPWINDLLSWLDLPELTRTLEDIEALDVDALQRQVGPVLPGSETELEEIFSFMRDRQPTIRADARAFFESLFARYEEIPDREQVGILLSKILGAVIPSAASSSLKAAA